MAWADTLLTGMSGLDELYLATIDGAVLDTLKLPSVRRRGVPDNLQRQVDDWGFGSTPFKQASVLGGLYRLSDGRTAVIHHDEAMEGVQPTGTITADIYVTVVAADRSTACVDGLVPHWKELRPVHTIVRDTLFLLDRRLNESEDGVETQVRAYRLSTIGCDWLSTG